jgi:hypothetical protein
MRISIMPTHMPSAIRSARKSEQRQSWERLGESSDENLVKHERHANAAEKDKTANIKQNTTNKGYFRGRRFS